jgi:hypothetical protein
LNPATVIGSLVVLAFVTIKNAIAPIFERWRSRRHLPSSGSGFRLPSPTALSRTESGTMAKLLLLAAVIAGVSGWWVVTAPAHELTALLLVWMAFVWAACLLD